MLEPAESASVCTDAASAAAVSRHTASCFQRSARTRRRAGTAWTRKAAPGASAPAPPAVSVRIQLVVIVCLLRFPAVVPFASSAPGFGSRSRFSGPPARQPFDQVQVSENHVRPELMFRRRVRGFRRSVRLRFRPPPPCPAPAPPGSVQVRMAAFRRPFFRSTTRYRPPVPLVRCSFRSWFVSQVRFVVRFSSVCFGLVRSVLFASVRFGLVLLFRF